MGTKTSKQKSLNGQTTITYRHPLVSENVHRIATTEFENLQNHHRAISLSSSQIDDRSLISLPSYSTRRETQYQRTHLQPRLEKKLSRSVENLSNQQKFVTAKELIYHENRRRGQSNLSNSHLSIPTLEKSSSSASLPRPRPKLRKKQIPENLQLASIDPAQLQHARQIGKGNFGTVYHAIYKGTEHVAIKSLHRTDETAIGDLREQYDDTSMNELLHEAYIMTRLKHANLLRIIGVTFFGSKQRLSLVTDFMKNGSLLDYLRKNRSQFLKSDAKPTTAMMNSFARQIFEAMSYLEEKNVIHRDLAARNCLIGENDTLKVGDFGLTTLTECGIYKGTYRSICAPRWTSPEAVVQSKYSSRSDVWSYGITLWEIYSLGDRPFGQLNNFAFRHFIENLSENISRHLPKPQQFASDETYTHIILPCLTYNVAMRPRFKDLRERLVTILF